MTQSIIVYRNPLEQMLWEGALPMFVPILSGALTFLVLVYIGTFVIDRSGLSPFSNRYNTAATTMLILAGAIASGVVAFLLH